MKLYLLSFLLLLCSCNHWDKISRQTERETRKFNRYQVLFCVRLGDYYRSFYFHRNGHFIQLDGPKKRQHQNQRFYAGTYIVNHDTVFMNYHNGVMPDSMANYLIKNTSANYFIYPYKNNTDTLRITIIQGNFNAMKSF